MDSKHYLELNRKTINSPGLMALYCMKDQNSIMETSHAYRLESELWGGSELNGLPLGAGSFDSTWQTAAYLSLTPGTAILRNNSLNRPCAAISAHDDFQLMFQFPFPLAKFSATSIILRNKVR